MVRISTPSGSGTGFMISNGKNNAICGIATAAHVLDHAHYWEEPIRVDHVSSGKSFVVGGEEGAVMLDAARDTAALLFGRGDLPFPADPLPLSPKDMFLKVGNDIAWLGFPAIPTASLCFFTGNVSAWIQDQSAYLVDGVAINGVSGGPDFHVAAAKGNQNLVVMGFVSAYVPNLSCWEFLS